MRNVKLVYSTKVSDATSAPRSADQTTDNSSVTLSSMPLFAKKIRRMDDAIAGLVAQLEQIATGSGMADRQNAEIPIATQQNDRFKPGEIPVVDFATHIKRAALQTD